MVSRDYGRRWVDATPLCVSQYDDERKRPSRDKICLSRIFSCMLVGDRMRLDYL